MSRLVGPRTPATVVWTCPTKTSIPTNLFNASSAARNQCRAEFIGGQEAAIKMFALLGFAPLVRLPDYVKDMQAIEHDYVLMGLDLETDEEYAGME